MPHMLHETPVLGPRDGAAAWIQDNRMTTKAKAADPGGRYRLVGAFGILEGFAEARS